MIYKTHKIRGSKDSVMYFNKGEAARNSKAKWLLENIFDSRLLSREFTRARELLKEGKFEESLKVFNNMIELIISPNPTGSTLGYILEHNIIEFGRNRIVKDLFKRTMYQRTTKQRESRLKQTNLRTTERQVKATFDTSEKGKKRFGINTEGVKEQGTLKIKIVNNKRVFYIQSNKTGKLLTPSEETKKEIGRKK